MIRHKSSRRFSAVVAACALGGTGLPSSGHAATPPTGSHFASGAISWTYAPGSPARVIWFATVAANAWSDRTNVKLTYTPDQNAQIRVSTGALSSLGETHKYTQNGTLLYATAQVDASRVPGLTDAKLQGTLSHEIGHALGLADYTAVLPDAFRCTDGSRFPASVMYTPLLEPNGVLCGHTGPTQEDIDGVNRMYPTPVK